MSARRWVLAAGAAVLLLAVGGGLGFLGARLSAPEDPPPWRPAWIGMVGQDAPAQRYGNFTLRPIGAQCGLGWVFGTHAEWEAKGQYCRIGVVIDNVDSVFHTFDTGLQHLVDATGRQYKVSFDAMRITRKPSTIEIGARDAYVMDLWYDVPKDARIVAIQMVGDEDPSSINLVADTPHPKGGVRLRLAL